MNQSTKTRIAHLSGPTATIQNTPPLVTSNKARAKHGLPLLKDAVGAYEKDLLQDALKSTRGNRAKAARLLDTTERIINYKVRQYTIDVRRFKS